MAVLRALIGFSNSLPKAKFFAFAFVLESDTNAPSAITTPLRTVIRHRRPCLGNSLGPTQEGFPDEDALLAQQAQLFLVMSTGMTGVLVESLMRPPLDHFKLSD